MTSIPDDLVAEIAAYLDNAAHGDHNTFKAMHLSLRLEKVLRGQE